MGHGPRGRKEGGTAERPNSSNVSIRPRPHRSELRRPIYRWSFFQLILQSGLHGPWLVEPTDVELQIWRPTCQVLCAFPAVQGLACLSPACSKVSSPVFSRYISCLLLLINESYPYVCSVPTILLNSYCQSFFSWPSCVFQKYNRYHPQQLQIYFLSHNYYASNLFIFYLIVFRPFSPFKFLPFCGFAVIFCIVLFRIAFSHK